MEIKVLASAESVAREGAAIIAAEAGAAIAARGRFILALSGGQTPWLMLRDLAGEDVPWTGFHVAQ
jgi:6-phosphogluconolactonase